MMPGVHTLCYRRSRTHGMYTAHGHDGAAVAPGVSDGSGSGLDDGDAVVSGVDAVPDGSGSGLDDGVGIVSGVAVAVGSPGLDSGVGEVSVVAVAVEVGSGIDVAVAVGSAPGRSVKNTARSGPQWPSGPTARTTA